MSTKVSCKSCLKLRQHVQDTFGRSTHHHDVLLNDKWNTIISSKIAHGLPRLNSFEWSDRIGLNREWIDSAVRKSVVRDHQNFDFFDYLARRLMDTFRLRLRTRRDEFRVWLCNTCLRTKVHTLRLSTVRARQSAQPHKYWQCFGVTPAEHSRTSPVSPCTSVRSQQQACRCWTAHSRTMKKFMFTKCTDPIVLRLHKGAIRHGHATITRHSHERRV